MSRHRYVNLIEELCKVSRLSDPAAILQGGPIEVNNIKFSLIHSEKIDPDLMFIYCDFGDPPIGRDSDVYRALLKQNLFFYKGSGPVFAISPDTGRVMLAQYERMDEITPDALLHRLSELSIQAQSWRKDPFILPEAAHQTTPQNKPSTPPLSLHRKTYALHKKILGEYSHD